MADTTDSRIIDHEARIGELERSRAFAIEQLTAMRGNVENAMKQGSGMAAQSDVVALRKAVEALTAKVDAMTAPKPAAATAGP